MDITLTYCYSGHHPDVLPHWGWTSTLLSADTIGLTATVEMDIKLAVLHSHSRLTPGRPLLALTLRHQACGVLEWQVLRSLVLLGPMWNMSLPLDQRAGLLHSECCSYAASTGVQGTRWPITLRVGCEFDLLSVWWFEVFTCSLSLYVCRFKPSAWKDLV